MGQETRSFTATQAKLLMTYFNVADELWPVYRRGRRIGVRLVDIDVKAVAQSRLAAEEFDLPWPPSLPEVGEYFLMHGPAIRHSLDWEAGVTS